MAVISCIDVGSRKVCTILANVSANRITEIQSVGITPSQGILRGIVQDLAAARDVVKDSVDKVEAATHRIGSPWVGFSGTHISSTNPEQRIRVESKKGESSVVQHHDIKALNDKFSKGFTAAERRRKIAQVEGLYTLDGKVSGVRNPLGMHAYQLDLQAHIVTAEESYMENLEECLNGAGIARPYEYGRFLPNAIASAEAVLEEEDKEEGVIVADIGADTTDIVVYHEGVLSHTYVLGVGGGNITRDLASGLSISSLEEAENLKKRCGLQPPEELEDLEMEMVEKRKISLDKAYIYIQARVEEILRMILYNSKYERFLPSSVVLTGGTANLVGLEDFAENVLRLPVRIGKPRGLPEPLPDTYAYLNDPAYAASIGLLLWGARQDVGSGRPSRSRGPSGPGLWEAIRNRLISLLGGSPSGKKE